VLGITTRALFGLIALGLAQFVTYLLDTQRGIGRILRCGHVILYLYAVMFLAANIMYLCNEPRRWQLAILSVLSATAQALVLIGLGQLLRRMVVMAEEAKTLV